MKHTHGVEGSRTTNPPSAPAAGPDAQTPPDWMDEARQIAAQCWCDTETSSIQMDAVLCEAVARRIAAWMRDAAQYARNAEYWRDQTEDLRRQLAEAQSLEALHYNRLAGLLFSGRLDELTGKEVQDFVTQYVDWKQRAETAEAALAAEQLRCKVAEERRDALSGELAAERAAREVAEQRERDARSELDSLPSGDLQKLGARLADLLSEDRWNEVEPMLQAALIERMQAERERAAAADLAKEECAKICEKRAAERFAEFGVVEDDTNAAYYDGNAADWRQAQDEEDENCAAAIRAIIADPAAVKRTLEDAARFRSLPKWIAAICWNKESNLPTLGHLKDGFSLDDLRAWLDDANAARKGEEGKHGS